MGNPAPSSAKQRSFWSRIKSLGLGAFNLAFLMGIGALLAASIIATSSIELQMTKMSSAKDDLMLYLNSGDKEAMQDYLAYTRVGDEMFGWAMRIEMAVRYNEEADKPAEVSRVMRQAISRLEGLGLYQFLRVSDSWVEKADFSDEERDAVKKCRLRLKEDFTFTWQGEDHVSLSGAFYSAFPELYPGVCELPGGTGRFPVS